MKKMMLALVTGICFNCYSQIEITVFRPDFLVPDGNGYLDVWKPEFSSPPKEYSLYIYCPYTNQLLFKTNDINEGWDGNNMFPQLYKYILIYVTEDNKIVEIKDSFMKNC